MATYTKRKRLNFGIARLNMVKHSIVPLRGWKVSSWSIHLGIWTWNSRTHASTVDVPELGGHFTF